MSLQVYCHFCKLPGGKHVDWEDCATAALALLESKEVWRDNQRLQKAHAFAVAALRELRSPAADEAVRMARGEQ